MAISDIEELDEALTSPSGRLIDNLSTSAGDLVVLGAGGKMGPTLCRLARRAFDAAGRSNDRIYAVSRWQDSAAAKRLADANIEIVRLDLLREADLGVLPDSENVVFMVGAKFGASANPHLTWAVNAAMPDRIARRYSTSRIAVMSTGNVYQCMPAHSGGSVETDVPQPIGEYAMSCLGRERVFEFAAVERGTKVALIRLNYAVDLRYGVLADIGSAVQAGEAIDLTAGCVNVVWQGYANEVILSTLAHASAKPFKINLTGPETTSIEYIARSFGELLGEEVTFVGEPRSTSLLSNASRCHSLFGYPSVGLASMIEWQAAWLQRGMPLLNKPTKFQVTDGIF